MIVKRYYDMSSLAWKNFYRYYDSKDLTKPLKVVACYIAEKRFRNCVNNKGRYWVVEFEDGRKIYEDSHGNRGSDKA